MIHFTIKKASLALVTLVALLSCKNATTGYTVFGTLKNVPDNSIVYVSANNTIIDSATVVEEKFTISGKINNPTNVYLRIKGTTDVLSFWLENKKITVEAERGNFRNGKVTGSASQKDQDELNTRLKAVHKRMETLDNSYADDMTSEELDAFDKKYETLEKEEAIIYQNFIRDFPNSIVSAYALNIYASTWGKKKTQELFGLLSSDNVNSKYGEKIISYINLNEEIKIGDHFVDFAMPNEKGITQKLSEVKGKVILLEFWASWCLPCRQENPKLVKTYDDFKAKGFEVFAVSLDKDKSSWLKAIDSDRLTWMHVSELNGDKNKAGLIYDVSGIPDNFLINQEGIIIGRNLKGDALRNKLEKVLK